MNLKIEIEERIQPILEQHHVEEFIKTRFWPPDLIGMRIEYIKMDSGTYPDAQVGQIFLLHEDKKNNSHFLCLIFPKDNNPEADRSGQTKRLGLADIFPRHVT